MRFTYPEQLAADAVAKSLGYESGKIVMTEKNRYRIDFGNDRFSHSQGVTAGHLNEWINGAVSVLGVAKRLMKEAEDLRQAALEDTIPDGDELVTELVKRCEANEVDTADMTGKLLPYIDGSAMTVKQIKELDSDLHVLTDDELQDVINDESASILQDSNIYRIALRVAYGETLITELRHEFASSENIHHPYLI